MDDPFPNCIKIPLESLSGSLTAFILPHRTIPVNVFVASHNHRKSETNSDGCGNACLTFWKPWRLTVAACVDRILQVGEKSRLASALADARGPYRTGWTTRFAH
jgi:hypothetical protein